MGVRMSYVNALTTIVQDRVNHLEDLYREKKEILGAGDKLACLKEQEALEKVLDILVGLDE